MPSSRSRRGRVALPPRRAPGAASARECTWRARPVSPRAAGSWLLTAASLLASCAAHDDSGRGAGDTGNDDGGSAGAPDRVPSAGNGGGYASAGSASGGKPGAGGANGAAVPPCADLAFDLDVHLSEAIASVANVDWSVSEPVESARIVFGRDPLAFEYQAPVPDPSPKVNRTLLLGMKPSTEYWYRVVVDRPAGTCAGPLGRLETGPITNGIPRPTVTTYGPERAFGGFTLLCTLGIGQDSWTLILDRDGDRVWWYPTAGRSDCSRALMSFDGSHFWMANANVPLSVTAPAGTLSRVRMDGTEAESFDVPYRHHDITVLPDESIAYIDYDESGATECDQVKEIDPETGETRVVFDLHSVLPDRRGECHSNAIHWWPEADLYTVSVLYWNSIVAFDRTGTFRWAFGGEPNTFSAVDWQGQHGHQLLESGIVLFNNSETSSSHVLEYRWEGTNAHLVLDFSHPDRKTVSFGNVQRLSNGNTLVTYSNQGVIWELDAAGLLVQEILFTGGAQVGYPQRRRTLYGPPPPYGE